MTLKKDLDLTDCLAINLQLDREYPGLFVVGPLSAASDDIVIRRRGPGKVESPKDFVTVIYEDRVIDGRYTVEHLYMDISAWMLSKPNRPLT